MPTDYEIKSLLEKTKPIVAENKRIREEREARGDFFNVFSILGMEHYEVSTHSAFLAELLNPNGSHGKKGAFLKMFVEAMTPHDTDKATLNADDAKVCTEMSTAEGRIDIIIEFHSSYAIIIENKIYAGDQELQLERYRNYAEKAYRGFTLFYLTLDGREPSEWSTGEKQDNPYWTCISYRDNIKNWLQKCAEISGENIKATIRQYIALIDKLTGQEMEDKMKKELTNLMMDNLDETLAILDNMDAFKTAVYEKFIGQMKELAKELDCEFVHGGDFGFWSWGRQDKFIYFRTKKHPTYQIGISGEGIPHWYICNEEASVVQKLECFDKTPNENYQDGWCVDYVQWNSATLRAICNGELKEYMRKCIEEILDDPNFPE